MGPPQFRRPTAGASIGLPSVNFPSTLVGILPFCGGGGYGLSRRVRNCGLVKVWDLPVRLFHWALVVVVLVAGLTETAAPANWLGVHLVAGYTLAGLLVARLVWALLGSEFSRFDRFVLAPRAVLGHLRA